METKNTHAKAQRTETEILGLLNTFGYLTAAQVAALVYPQHAQKLVMARRTLLRMHRAGLVLVRKGVQVYSEQHYALSRAGSRELFQRTGIEAMSGKDLLRITSPHRDAANWGAIHMMSEGYTRVWTEREILTGRCPVRTLAGKVPDVLGVDQEGYCTWVEVESSRRGGRDMQKLASWLVHHAFPPSTDRYLISLDPPADSLYLSEVRFVIALDTAATFPQRLLRALRQHVGIDDPMWWAQDRIQIQHGIDPNARIVSGLY